jgi:hypothetical protein
MILLDLFTVTVIAANDPGKVRNKPIPFPND